MKFIYTFDLLDITGHRIMTAKTNSTYEDAQRVAETYLMMFSDVAEVRVTERADLGYSHSWITFHDGDSFGMQVDLPHA